MTHEKKSKAYDEALKAAVVAYKDEDKHLKATLERIFPELAESKDENIRKELISFVRNDGWKFTKLIKEEKESWISWIEKQGKPVEINPTEFDLQLNRLLVQFESLAKEELASSLSFYLNVVKYGWPYKIEKRGEHQKCANKEYTFKAIPRLLEMIQPTDRAKAYCQKLIDSLEKEGYSTDAKIVRDHLKMMNGEKVAMATMDEQKPADKVKPKFNVGDWITNGKYTLEVANITERGYVLRFQDGNIVYYTISYIDKDFNIWNISDANDGDVLCDGTTIFILKDSLSDGSVMSYCDCDTDSGESDSFCHLVMNLMCSKITPANKEQRDTLEKAMSNAGYTFDFEKKELKEIEKEEYNGEDYGIDGLWHAKNILEKTLGKVDGYQTDDGILEHKCAIDAVKSLYESKYKWNEWDDIAVKDMCDKLNRLSGTYCQEYIKWLKSLKDRYAWKPSEDQIESLEHFVRSIAESGYASPYDARTNLIKSLLDQLKKL